MSIVWVGGAKYDPNKQQFVSKDTHLCILVSIFCPAQLGRKKLNQILQNSCLHCVEKRQFKYTEEEKSML